jgi:hypothetical protein
MGSHSGMILVGKPKNPKKHLSRATLSTISPHVLAWVRTEASVMRDHGTALFPWLFLPFVTHTFALYLITAQPCAVDVPGQQTKNIGEYLDVRSRNRVVERII